jgi:hypothetical protein
VRAQLYRYSFTRLGEPGWWKRTLIGEYMPALTREQVQEALRALPEGGSDF